jgi:hypothetical protein
MWNALPNQFPPQAPVPQQQLPFHDPHRQAGQHILAALGVARPPPSLGMSLPVAPTPQPLVRDLTEIWNILESLGPIPNGSRALDKLEFHARLMHLFQVHNFLVLLEVDPQGKAKVLITIESFIH